METSIKSRKHQHEGIFAKSFKKRKHNNLKRCPLTSAKALNAHMIQHQVNHHNWLPYTERTEMCVCGGGDCFMGEGTVWRNQQIFDIAVLCMQSGSNANEQPCLIDETVDDKIAFIYTLRKQTKVWG